MTLAFEGTDGVQFFEKKGCFQDLAENWVL